MSLKVSESDVICVMKPVTDNLGNKLFIPVCSRKRVTISNRASSGSGMSSSGSSGLSSSTGTSGVDETSEQEEGGVPPVNTPYPFKMIGFPYAFIGVANDPPKKAGLKMRGID